MATSSEWAVPPVSPTLPHLREQIVCLMRPGIVVCLGPVWWCAWAQCGGVQGPGAVVCWGPVRWCAGARCAGVQGPGAVVCWGPVWLTQVAANAHVRIVLTVTRHSRLTRGSGISGVDHWWLEVVSPVEGSVFTALS